MTDSDKCRSALAGLRGVGENGRAVGSGERDDGRLVGYDHDAVKCRRREQRVEHVAHHRLGEAAELGRRELLAQARLGEREALDGEDRERAHQPVRVSASSSVWAASWRRAVELPIQVSQSRERIPWTGSSATIASISGP